MRNPRRLLEDMRAAWDRARTRWWVRWSVDLLFVVLKKDDCVYDFSYVSPLGRFEERLMDFESLVHGFRAQEAS